MIGAAVMERHLLLLAGMVLGGVGLYVVQLLVEAIKAVPKPIEKPIGSRWFIPNSSDRLPYTILRYRTELGNSIVVVKLDGSDRECEWGVNDMDYDLPAQT